MNSLEQHPDSILFDQLRAGLLDDNPEQKAEIEHHLQQCGICRRAHDWPSSLRGSADELSSRLDERRRRALSAQPARRHRALIPVAAAATLALVAVSLVNLNTEEPETTPQLATNGQSSPDLYEDLDFYLWLADHKDSGDSST